MSTSVFGIGISGLNAAQAGLVTTGHNITNASTPGFSRQEIVQSSNIPQLTGAGFIGSGVQVSTVKRLYSDFLSNQVNLAQTQGSQLDSYYAQINQIDNMLGDVSAGLSPALQDFFSGINGVAANPASMPSRQAMISGAAELVSRFQTINQRLTEIRSGINTAIGSSVGVINSMATQIAKLNSDISLAEAATNMQPANDLRDQRDALVAELNKEIKATVVRQSDGSYNVFIGNGQPLVVGKQTFSVVAAASQEDAGRIEVGYKSGASTVLLSSSTLDGGSLGGLLAFRGETLDVAQNAIGRVAIALTQGFNDQHRLGQDLNGVAGVDFFTVAAPVVLSRTGNTGTGNVTASIKDVSALSTSDYLLQYNGTDGSGFESYTLTRTSDRVKTSISFDPAEYPKSVDADGFQLTIDAGAALNDVWTIQPTRAGALDIAVAVTDPTRIAAASQIRTAAGASNQGEAAITGGRVTNATLWSDAANSKDLTIRFSVAGGVTTYDIVDNISGNSLMTGGAASLTGPHTGTYSNGGTIALSQTGSPAFDLGAQVVISGWPVDGDTFAIGSNSGAVSDNSNAVLLGALQTANTLGKDATVSGGQPVLTYQQAYAQLVSHVGNKARQIDVMSTAQRNLVAQTTQAQQSVTGVNLDDEAANLLRYQQAYQAAGKMMQIATGLFQTLLQINQ